MREYHKSSTSGDEDDGYIQAYHDGLHDGKVSDMPDMKSSFDMATYAGMREAEFYPLMGSSYIKGYLAGFAEARPHMHAKGLVAAFNERVGYDVRRSAVAASGRQGNDEGVRRNGEVEG